VGGPESGARNRDGAARPPQSAEEADSKSAEGDSTAADDAQGPTMPRTRERTRALFPLEAEFGRATGQDAPPKGFV